RIVAALRQVVTDSERILPPAEITRRSRGKIIRESEKNLGSEGLQECSPGLAGQGRPQGADALGGNHRDALWLSGQTEELFISGWLALSHGCEMLVLIAEEQDFTK